MFPSERHKGRSSSFSISRVLQGSVAYILGSNLCPGLLHCYSSANRSDGSSRGRDVEPPTRDLPDWFLQLAKGDYRKFDAVVCSSRYSKNPARWLRFLLLLCGDIERNPGPKRGKMNLNMSSVIYFRNNDLQDLDTKLGKWHGTAVAEARGRFFVMFVSRKLAEANVIM